MIKTLVPKRMQTIQPSGRLLRLARGTSLLVLSVMLSTSGFAFEPDSVEYFETKIRPVLVQHCYECHSQEADEIGGSLWLDSSDAMLSGGDSGPSIAPGDAGASILISALQYESSEMPPNEQLPKHVINDFVRWVEAGAVDPRRSDGELPLPKDSRIDLEQGRKFWSFQPITDFRMELSDSQAMKVSSNVIDHLIDGALNQQGLQPNAPASAQQRLRRLSFDLTGLPPSHDMLQRWQSEPSDEQWQRLVDEMLQSRAFAQHWARHWMDLARYADSNGSDFNATFHDAWRYRDYLISSFSQDRPFDQMIRQQVAGDLMNAENDQQRHDNVVATTFLMLGAKMLSERDKVKLELDVVDEQIDTIGRAFLGMTLGCARCHDHKFDPIATEDYYALAGIFKSTQTLNGESQKYVSTWNRTPLPTSDEHRHAVKEHAATLQSLQQQIKQSEKAIADLNSVQMQGVVIDDSEATLVGQWKASTYSKPYIGKGYVHDNNTNKGKASIEFRTRLPKTGDYRVRFAYAASGSRARKVPVTILGEESNAITLDQSKRKGSDAAPWATLGTFRFTSDSDAVVTIRNDETEGYVLADAVQFVSVDEVEDDQQTSKKHEQRIQQAQAELDEIKKRLATLKENAPDPLPTAMAPKDWTTDRIADSPVHIRGEVKNIGELVPRGFLRVCSSDDSSIPRPEGSGRLELAQWLTDPDNPLVARVLVNRIWLHLLGEGIVRTPDNFGSRGERPTHPELLDALAMDLMRDGWRLKPMIRRIVLSKTYNRSTQFDSAKANVDPENRLLWRANRRRLTAESIRDAMLSVSGSLTQDEPAAPVDHLGVLVSKNNGDSKAVAFTMDLPVRTVYLPIIRGNVDPLLTMLDSADPDMLVGKRPTTNVPSQALVLLNSKAIHQWAARTADQIWDAHETWNDRITAAYEICYCRTPTADDLELAKHYLGAAPNEQDTLSEENERGPFRDFVAAIFASTEFRLLD